MNKATAVSSLAVRTHVGRNGKNFGSFEWEPLPTRLQTPGSRRFDILMVYSLQVF
jgi:hypothetical protein